MSYFGHYPSIELQALAFVERALSKNREDQSIGTEWNGFAVQLGYLYDLEIAERQFSSALNIAEIAIPPKYQCEKCLSAIRSREENGNCSGFLCRLGNNGSCGYRPSEWA